MNINNMDKPEAWVERILYVFLVGNHRSSGAPITKEELTDSLTELLQQLKERLGGITKMKPFQAMGDTCGWGKEPTTVVLVLAESTDQITADLCIASQAKRLAKALTQDQVWITKQTLDLYIANSSLI